VTVWGSVRIIVIFAGQQVERYALRRVKLRTSCLESLVIGFGMLALCSAAQTTNLQVYTLLSGSQLTDECPICDRIPIVLPLKGTFGLRILDQTPISTRYDLLNISFQAGTTSGPEYQVVGSGVYQVGGEVAVSQQMFVNAVISNGFTNVNALCMSTSGPVSQPWPRIQIQVDQTNGTASKVYHLTLVAVPAPQFRSIIADAQSRDVILAWDGNGGMVQLERAPGIGGPYSAASPIITNSSFTDAEALTNSAQFFYRLHPF
jgi:hypothetical protein